MERKTVPFNFPEEIQEIFTTGDCWHLATTILRLSSFPIVTVEEETREGKSCWLHVANRLPDGRVLDIEGIWAENDWLANWHDQLNIFYTNEDDFSLFSRNWKPEQWATEISHPRDLMYPESEHTASQYAKEMLDQFAQLMPKTLF